VNASFGFWQEPKVRFTHTNTSCSKITSRIMSWNTKRTANWRTTALSPEPQSRTYARTIKSATSSRPTPRNTPSQARRVRHRLNMGRRVRRLERQTDGRAAPVGVHVRKQMKWRRRDATGRITITIQQYPDSPAHVDGPMTTQDASQHSGNAKDLTPCV
jgi:hypothetical protein